MSPVFYSDNSKNTRLSQKSQKPYFNYNYPIYRGAMGLCFDAHIDNNWDTKEMLQFSFPDYGTITII